MIKKYNKLVRDKIPEIIMQQGNTPKVATLTDAEYFTALNQKLTEEVAEYLEDYSIEELADIMEVVYAIAKHRGLSREELEKLRFDKRNNRGAFDKKICLLEVQMNQQ